MTINYPPLVDRFVSYFKVQQRLSNVYSWTNETSFTKPFITVAREPGSGGRPIAHAVAEKLGFFCLDENIIDEISTSVKQRRQIIKNMDERTRSVVEDILDSVLNPEHVDDMKYVTVMARVILSYAFRGKVVIIGRGGNFLTPFAKGLHVNITAPYDIRVQRAMEHEGFDEERAKEVIAEMEKERKAFVKQYLRRDPSKINSFDLTLNTTYFSVEAARDLIIDAFYHKFPRQLKMGPLFKRG